MQESVHTRQGVGRLLLFSPSDSQIKATQEINFLKTGFYLSAVFGEMPPKPRPGTKS